MSEPSWVPRAAAARARVAAAGDDSGTLMVVDRVIADLHLAEADRASLRAALADLDPDRAAAELKNALRSRLDPTAEDTALIATMRRRHDTVSTMANRLEELEGHIDATLVDLDLLVARIHERTLDRSPNKQSLADELERLRIDSIALAEAHRELDRM